MTAYLLHLAIMAGIYIILTVGLNLIIGYAGQISLGHAAFFGVGAYVSALMALRGHFSFPLAALAAMLAAAASGLALGLPTLRLKEDYLAIVTLGFGVIMDMVFLNLDITGGPDGLAGIPARRLRPARRHHVRGDQRRAARAVAGMVRSLSRRDQND